MAYDCSGGCARLQFWSNPDVNFGTVPNQTPMGTETNNNTRMINEKFANIMSYLQPDNNVFLNNNDVSSNIEGEIIAKNKVDNYGNVTIKNTQSYSFIAGEEIVLRPGFTAEVGSEFVAEILEIEDCGSPDGENSDFGLDPDLTNYKATKFKELVTDISVYPNPLVYNNIKLSINLTQKCHIIIKIFNLLGEEVQNIGDFEVNGNFEKNIELTKLPDGTYFITINKLNEKVLTHKFIKL